MLKDTLRKLQLLIPSKPPLDVAKFGCPLALIIQWSP